MNWDVVSFDWNLIRTFLATVEEGSISAASRKLGQTQPTLSRHISALEEALGITLFERSTRRIELTGAGVELLDHVREMASAATRISLTASGQSQSIEGEVRITATDTVCAYLLPGITKLIHRQAPNVRLLLLPDNRVKDLTKREADISIRYVEPNQPNLIAKRITTTYAHFYASEKFLKEHGPIKAKQDLMGMPMVGFEPLDECIFGLKKEGIETREEQFGLSTASGIALTESIRQGVGVSVVPKHIADQFSDLVPILMDEFAFPIPVWLVTHRELHTSRRIRIVFDILADELKKL